MIRAIDGTMIFHAVRPGRSPERGCDYQRQTARVLAFIHPDGIDLHPSQQIGQQQKKTPDRQSGAQRCKNNIHDASSLNVDIGDPADHDETRHIQRNDSQQR